MPRMALIALDRPKVTDKKQNIYNAIIGIFSAVLGCAASVCGKRFAEAGLSFEQRPLGATGCLPRLLTADASRSVPWLR